MYLRTIYYLEAIIFLSAYKLDYSLSFVFLNMNSLSCDVYESRTEDVQCSYESLLLVIQDSIKLIDVSVQKLIINILKWRHISSDFIKDLVKAKTIDCVFDLIRICSRWYQVELLDHIVDFPALKESACLQKLAEYKEELKTYFRSRMKQFSNRRGIDKTTLILTIDGAWDKQVLQGEHSNKTCKQIVLALGREGRVIGHGFLDEQRLYIDIS